MDLTHKTILSFTLFADLYLFNSFLRLQDMKDMCTASGTEVISVRGTLSAAVFIWWTKNY